MKEQLSGQYCVCLFVDGLDEFQGDSLEHRQLAEAFVRWSKQPHVQCLLSSRPYPEFNQIFPEETRLHLHQLNKQDIHIFSFRMFERDTNFEQVCPFHASLIYRVVQSSEGVFLWAVLVVRILLSSAAYETKDMLFRKVNALPKKLEKLYQCLLDSLETVDR